MFSISRKHLKILAGSLLLILFGGFFFIKDSGHLNLGKDGVIESYSRGLNPGEDQDFEANFQDEDNSDGFTKTGQEFVKVYIAGQVVNPGVIEVPCDCRLDDAVKMAGGFLQDADLLRINLAMMVEDEGMYLIPRIGDEDLDMDSLVQGAGQTTSSKVNINRADQNTLETLPQIGPVTASSIIEYRETKGAFKSIEEIMEVPNIGQKTFEGIKELITVR